MNLWIVVTIVFIVVLLAILVQKKASPTYRNELENAITMAGGIIAAFSFLWAAYTYNESARLQKELSAYNIYNEHQKISIENPKFLGPSELAQMSPPMQNSSDELKRDYEAYQWYVGHGLFSFESILAALPGDEGWERTFKGFMESHNKYLGSKEFDCDRYSKSVQDLLKKTVVGSCVK